MDQRRPADQSGRAVHWRRVGLTAVGLPLIAAACWLLPMHAGAAPSGPDEPVTTPASLAMPKPIVSSDQQRSDDHGDDDSQGDGEGDHHGDDEGRSDGKGDGKGDGGKGDEDHGDEGGKHRKDKEKKPKPERSTAPTTTARPLHTAATPKVKATNPPRRSTSSSSSPTTTSMAAIPTTSDPPTTVATTSTTVKLFAAPPTTEPLSPVPAFPAESRNLFQRIPLWLPVGLLLGASAGILMAFTGAVSTGVGRSTN